MQKDKGAHSCSQSFIQETPILTVPHVFVYVRLMSALIFHQSSALATGKACNARRRHQRFDFQASRVSWVNREAIPYRLRHAPHVKMCFPGCVMLMLAILREKTLSILLQAVLQGIQRHKGHVFL